MWSSSRMFSKFAPPSAAAMAMLASRGQWDPMKRPGVSQDERMTIGFCTGSNLLCEDTQSRRTACQRRRLLPLSTPSPVQCDTIPRGSRQQFEAIKEFRAKLARGETLVGIGIQFTDPVSVDALSDTSDFFWFDTEHIAMSPTELKVHMIVAHGKGCPCMVRVPGPNRIESVDALPWGTWIKHALDANADAIAVPQVRTAEEVRSIVADCHYPRGGSRSPPFNVAQPSTKEMKTRMSRGFGPTIPMNYGRIPQAQYLEEADKNIFVCVMIETIEALENLDEIAAVEGLDCLILGANDLSAALGVPYLNEHPLTVDATDKIIAAAKKHGKYVMFSTRYPDMAKKLAAKGCQILHVGHDVLAAVGYQTKLVNDIKGTSNYVPR
eukprot:gnl/TRDRNA2_/TRDRNA2_46018_c0_seq2.p1 gnl/TRDRNA2_/TRDRNA2_46018_c0~~gnl/TRDRNA2_/TRDRNA2_46018_c0_seq2.p1  ORF type:complete len:381 (+),score=44.17 gnl/TRDRNA2_/TRDRNA2_46018_c0_seq2:33-1175(+)